MDKVRLQRVFHVRYVSYVPRYAEFRVMGLVFVPSLILLLSSKFRSDYRLRIQSHQVLGSQSLQNLPRTLKPQNPKPKPKHPKPQTLNPESTAAQAQALNLQ